MNRRFEPEEAAAWAALWGDYSAEDWKADSIALVASDGHGNGCVLQYDGAHIDYQLCEVGRDLRSLSLDDAPEGLSIWIGRWETYRCGWEVIEYDCQVEGAFRPLTPAEWADLAGGNLELKAQAKLCA